MNIWFTSNHLCVPKTQGNESRLRSQRCVCRKSNPSIFVVQSADEWAAKNTPRPLHGAR